MKISFTPVVEGRSFLSGIKKLLTLLIGTSLMFVVPLQSSWAKEHVITICFGGTRLPITAWQGDAKTEWGDYVNAYKRPSLIASLHHHHLAHPDDGQHTIYVSGVGASHTVNDGCLIISVAPWPL